MNPLDYTNFISHINEKPENDAVSIFITQIRTKEEIALELILKYKDSIPPEPELLQIDIEKEFNQELEKIRSEHWGRLTVLPPTELTIYLSFHYKIYLERHPGRELDFLSFIAEDIEVLKRKENIQNFVTENRFKIINEWIDKKRKELETSTVPDQLPEKPFEKIKWKGTPSQFGYLFLELVKHGFIEPPLYNGEINFTGLARLCNEYFDINTTPGNLTKEMNPDNEKAGTKKNTLSETNRAKFNIPNLSDLA